MTLIKLKNNNLDKSFNNFIDDFFPQFPSLFGEGFYSNGFKNPAPVNIKENEKEYELELIAPGFSKEDIEINLDNNILTVSAERKAENEASKGNEIRKEFKFQSFKRSFTIDEKIDTTGIAAKYLNGVLLLNLPKKVEVKEATKQISIL